MCRLILIFLLAGLSASSQQMSPADKFALSLQRTYQQQGYDIDVAYDESKHQLTLKSDLLTDATLREALVRALHGERQTLCGIGIWYLKVGYSKGWFSSDVMKSASMGCPAARAARIQATQTAREELAR